MSRRTLWLTVIVVVYNIAIIADYIFFHAFSPISILVLGIDAFCIAKLIRLIRLDIRR